MCFGPGGITGEGAFLLFLKKSSCYNEAGAYREERIHVVAEEGRKKLSEE